MSMLEPATNAEAHVDMPLFAEKTIRRMPLKVEPLNREPLTSADLFALQRRFDRFISQLNPPRRRNWTDDRRSPAKGEAKPSPEHSFENVQSECRKRT